MTETTDSRGLLRNWRPRLTVRVRLAATVAAIVAAFALLTVAAIYAFMTYVPDYSTAVMPTYPLVDLTQTEGVPAQMVSTEATQAYVLESLLGASLIACAAIAVLGAVVAWIVSGRILRPLTRITDAARQASHGALDHRVGLAGPNDEFLELATTFDEMLDRLERAMHSHRRFAANASHELKTPLATTKAMLDVAVADPDHYEWPELLRRLRETNQRSIDTVEALLDLSDIDNADVHPVDVRMDALVDQSIADVRRLARQRSIAIEWSPVPLTTLGEPTLLARLVSNVIENAVRHNVDGGVVAVTLAVRPEAHALELVVENSGPPLDDALLSTMGDPFLRGSGRVRSSHAGHGLGLAIASSIAQAHDGALTFRVRPHGGVIATITLPHGPAPAR